MRYGNCGARVGEWGSQNVAIRRRDGRGAATRSIRQSLTGCRARWCTAMHATTDQIGDTRLGPIRLRPAGLFELGPFDKGQFDLGQFDLGNGPFFRLRPTKISMRFSRFRPIFFWGSGVQVFRCFVWCSGVLVLGVLGV